MLLIVFSLTGSCERNELPAGTPECIREKIDEIRKEPIRNPPAQVWRVDVNDKPHYYITSRCCDIMSELYDAECTLVCHPDGGITGTGDGLCPDGFDLAGAQLIWTDDRHAD